MKLIEGTIDWGTHKAFETYIEMLEKKGFKPKNHTLIENGDPTCEEHLLWLCYEAKNKIKNDGTGFSVDKYSRWLGFVQGCLICRKYTTVEKERNRTRPWFKPGSNEGEMQ